MQKIDNNDLKKIKGGGINWSLWAGVGGLASFIVGLVDGFIHTKKCNS